MRKLIALTGLCTALFFAPLQANAQGSVNHSAQASEHSAQATGHVIVGGVKGVASVAAVPLVVSGAIGHSADQAGQAMADFADMPIGKPLPITEKTVTAGPAPSQALKQQQEAQ